MPLRWGWFAIALALVWVAQSGVLWPLGLARWVDLYLLLVLVLALTAPRYDAALAGWFAGLVQDLASADVLGIHALSLGLTAWLVTRLRERVNLTLTRVRVVACVLVALAGQLVYVLHLRFWIVRVPETLPGLLASAAAVSLVAGLVAGLWTGRRSRRGHRTRGGADRFAARTRSPNRLGA